MSGQWGGVGQGERRIGGGTGEREELGAGQGEKGGMGAGQGRRGLEMTEVVGVL